MDDIGHELDLVPRSLSCEERDGSISPLLQHTVAHIAAMFEKRKSVDDLITSPNLDSPYQFKSGTLPRKQIRYKEVQNIADKHPLKPLNNHDVKIHIQPNPSPAKPPRVKRDENFKTMDCKHLIMAAKEGNMEVVQWLLQHGADTNIRDSKGRSALLVAACCDRLGVFKYLLQITDVNQKDLNGWNALHIGVVAGHQRIVEESRKHISLDSRSASGLTALCLAVNRGHLHMVEYFLKEGADVMIPSIHGWTPLHFAARNKHHLILYVLLNSGKCKNLLNVCTSEGMTPLALAVQSGSLDCVRLLLDSGANPNPKDKKGWTPARIAAINNFRDIAQYLANYKAVL